MKLLILLSSPLNQRTEWLLDSLLREVGLTQSQVKIAVAGQRVSTKNVNCVLACGKEALKVVLSDWTGNPAEKRGYIWQRKDGTKVVATVDLDLVSDVWVPWRVLIGKDLKKAVRESGSRELTRIPRKVTVVDLTNIKEVMTSILSAQDVAADIENRKDKQTLACLGFAPNISQAYVFPPNHLDRALWLLEQRAFIWANGQYDLYFTYTRCGVKASISDDTQLAWHSCYPELAGQTNEDRKGKGNRHTRKSLSFLASIFTDVEWWKDYDFTTEVQRYELNGRDCCVTLEIMLQLRDYVKSMGVEEIYRQEIALVWPCVEIQARGLLVDDKLRKKRLRELEGALESNEGKLVETVLPLIDANWDRIDRQSLFEDVWTCPCCRNGRAKTVLCWQCAGLDCKPRKKDLRTLIANSGWKAAKRVKMYAKLDSMKVAEATEFFLAPCQKCDGDGQRITREFNPSSGPQKQILLYQILKLPKRVHKGTLKVDEATIKDLLAHAKEDGRKILQLLLTTAKFENMRTQYERIKPSPKDGRIRTVLAPMTETGRFTSKESFLEESTNLQNLPKKTAVADSRFNVRSCIRTDPNRVMYEVDYSSAERRLLAYLARESRAIEQIEMGINSYKWFAERLFGEVDDWQELEKKNPLYHIAKTAVLALDRGVSWRRLQESVNKDADITGAAITAAEAKRAEGLFHEIYPGYRKYFEEIEAEILSTGCLTNICGRMRIFFGRKGKSNIAAVVREGVSFKAQAIGDVINAAMVRIFESGDPDILRLLLQVHDSLLFDCLPEDMDRAIKLVVGEMEKPIKLPSGREIVIPAEASWTKTNWAEMEDYDGSTR